MFLLNTPLGMLLVVVAMLLAFYSQIKMNSTYQKYRNVRVRSGRTGADVAREILRDAGLAEVQVEAVGGTLTDHYDPRTRTVRLSQEVYAGSSVAALGVAAHETGHALQHKEQYGPLAFRSAILPLAGFGSNAAFPLFILGMFMGSTLFMDLGILLFTGAVLFQIITLPVEFNASSRAIELLSVGGYVSREEEEPVKRVLRAAGYTYLAATAVALANLLRLVLLRGSRRD